MIRFRRIDGNTQSSQARMRALPNGEPAEINGFVWLTRSAAVRRRILTSCAESAMEALPISRQDAVALLNRLGAPPDIETYLLILAIDGGVPAEKVDFQDGTTIFLDHSCRAIYGTFKAGWDTVTRRAAYVLISEDAQ